MWNWVLRDDLRSIDGMTFAMMLKLGKNEVKTLEDFAACAADDLVGWTERIDGKSKRFAGFLDSSGLSRVEAEQMIIAARLKIGWINEQDLKTKDEPVETETETETETEEIKKNPDRDTITIHSM